MARNRNSKSSAATIPLRQPDRSAPSEQTLLKLAQERGLFEQAQKKETTNNKQQSRSASGTNEDEDNGADLSPTVERVMETLLWTVSLAMLHFTLDVLVQHQYAVAIKWSAVWTRAVFALIFYHLHHHACNPPVVPGIPARFQYPIRQAIFFLISLVAGPYLIYITNEFGYYAVMKQSPPLGCLWIWSIIELELPYAVLSLAGAGVFMWYGGYGIR